MPKLSAYRADAPKKMSPDCEIYKSAPVNGAVVQGDATKPEIAPMTNTPI